MATKKPTNKATNERRKKPAKKTGYDSDVSDEEWAFCAPYLILMKEDAPQREHELRTVFNAVRYMATILASSLSSATRLGVDRMLVPDTVSRKRARAPRV